MTKSKKSTLNSMNLKSHWTRKYMRLLRSLRKQAKTSGLPLEETFLSSNILNSLDTSTPTIEYFFSQKSSSPVNSTGRPTLTPALTAVTVVIHAAFDPNVYKTMFFEYLVSNDLPFAHVDSPGLEALLSFVRRCPTTSLPHLTIKSMRADLDTFYFNEQGYLKRRLANHKGRFAFGVDEFGVGNNYDFLAVTLHFHNDQSVFEKYMIGFELLNADTSYTDNVLYQHLDRVLSEYDIKDRIISITRDNAGPLNTLMEKFKKEFDDNDPNFEFSGDIRCSGHVLNLAEKAFLCCTSSRTNNAVTFRASFESVKDIIETLTMFSNIRGLYPKLCIIILAILKARELLRDELSIIADSFQDMQMKRDANQDVSVAEDTTAPDDATLADDASSAQSFAASSDDSQAPTNTSCDLHN